MVKQISAENDYPYSDVLDRLVFSTMKAMSHCYTYLSINCQARTSVAVAQAVEKISDHEINKEFVWWPKNYKKGEMRHISSTDPKNGNEPLISSTGKVSTHPTRISKIVKRWVAQTFSDNLTKPTKNYWAPSPLFIVEELLSSSTAPSFSAYSLYAIRIYLFSEYMSAPSGLLGSTTLDEFTERDIQDAYSGILTSANSRYHSQGKDTLYSQQGVNGILQQYLAYRNILVLSFKSWKNAADYFKTAEIIPKKRSRIFQKNNQVARMPEVSQVINELWGVPIPIRGADTLLRGGLKVSSNRGLVVAIHGGPGTGKTSFCLALTSSLTPFGIETFYLSAEEQEPDLRKRSQGLFSDEMLRLPFFKNNIQGNIDNLVKFSHINVMKENNISNLIRELTALEIMLEKDDVESPSKLSIPKPCRSILVLDGFHDLFIQDNENNTELNGSIAKHSNQLVKLHELIDKLQKLRAIVILTISDDWENGKSLDYMVDMAMRLSFTEVEAYDAKPDRRVTLFKARHQQCAFGTHGIQISGDKGVRFSPQINHQLDKRAVWKTRLPNKDFINPFFFKNNPMTKFINKETNLPHEIDDNKIFSNEISIPHGSNIFINGNGSGGKAGLAMCIAFNPFLICENDKIEHCKEKVLIISFLYPREYYIEVLKLINKNLLKKFGKTYTVVPRVLDVIHLYPGYLKPNDLYNRIDWEIEAAERVGEPYTSVIIDGLHNVFLQFPEIQKYPIFWPQLYNSLRSRLLNIITTHTTLVMQDDQTPKYKRTNVDDDRSEPLRHALVQKTDFQITVEPIDEEGSEKFAGFFEINFLSAIGQQIGASDLYWDRENLELHYELENNKSR